MSKTHIFQTSTFDLITSFASSAAPHSLQSDEGCRALRLSVTSHQRYICQCRLRTCSKSQDTEVNRLIVPKGHISTHIDSYRSVLLKHDTHRTKETLTTLLLDRCRTHHGTRHFGTKDESTIDYKDVRLERLILSLFDSLIIDTHCEAFRGCTASSLTLLFNILPP